MSDGISHEALDRLQEKIGAEVRRLRLLRPGTDAHLVSLARAAGLSVQHLSDCERGNRRFSNESLARVAGALGVSVVDLVVAAGGCVRCSGSGVDPQERAPTEKLRYNVGDPIVVPRGTRLVVPGKKVAVTPGTYKGTVRDVRVDDDGVLSYVAVCRDEDGKKFEVSVHHEPIGGRTP